MQSGPLISLRRRILDRCILRPSRDRLPHEPKQRFEMLLGNLTTEYFVEEIPSPSDDPPELLIIKFPGTAGRAERATGWPSGALNDFRSDSGPRRQIACRIVSWNAPGYGQSGGRASLATIPHYASQFCERLLDSLADCPQRVWLAGNSLGCATATYVASQLPQAIDGLLLRNPPPLVETVKRVADRYPLGGWTAPIAESLPLEMNLLQTASQASCPVVVLHSELDALVPTELQQLVFDSFSSPKRMVTLEGIGHAGLYLDEHQAPIREAVQWLWNSASQNASTRR